MKIVSIRMENVRRFVDPVTVPEIGDGLNLICEPNESGKSTIFDALHALFFMPHRTTKDAVKKLQPHAGGAPEVAVEVETAEGRFLIEKRWLSRSSARVTRGGDLVAQADAAENWIKCLVGADAEGGPSGLLWVRQGETRFDPKKDGTIAARRDLLSSVGGEVEAMTGGRRMDAVLARCRDELGRYATDTGRPKTGGAWKDALDAVSELTTRRDGLAANAAELHDALDRRRQVRRELAALEEPEAVASRKERLEQATAAHDAAKAHADKVTRADEALKLARLRVESAAGELDRLLKARTELTAAAEESGRATAARAEAEEARAAAELSLATAEAAFAEAAETAEAARRTWRMAIQQEKAAEGRRRGDELRERIARAGKLRAEADEASAEEKAGPDEAAMRELDKLFNEVATDRALCEAAAPSVSISYFAGAEDTVTIGGAPLTEGERRAIPSGAELELRGIGRLTIRPGEGAGDDHALRQAEQALAGALARTGLPDIDAVRRAAATRVSAGERRRAAEAQLTAIAPDGIDALRAELAAIPEVEPVEGLPPSADAEARAERAEYAKREAEAQRDAARRRATDDSKAAALAEAAEKTAANRLHRAQASVPADPDAEEGRLRAVLVDGRERLAEAEDRHRRLVAEAPDMEEAEAALKRARQICADADREIRENQTELAKLDERIASRSDDAVEEKLAETEDLLKAATADRDCIAAEVETLRTLRDALEQARTEARERYFEPVMRELTPLLRLLWPDAEPVFDDQTLLPRGLVRRGREESVDILSGGTQEQIAILVRLAFARLLAGRGEAAPVILDDALVHSDDDRIERMFDALNREAERMQIIVLSCRQKAFRELGGRKLRLAPGSAMLEAAE